MTVVNRRPAVHLHVLPGLRWFFNLPPLAAFLVSLGFSPLLLWLNDWLFVWGRVLPLSYQYVAALFDSVLAAGIGLMIWQCRRIYFDELPRWCRWALARKWVHVSIVGAWAAFAIVTKLMSGDAAKLSRLQGVNSMYHPLLLMPILGYVYTLLLMVAFAHIFTTYNKVGAGLLLEVVTAVALLIAGGWIAAASYDRQHLYTPTGEYKQDWANPDDPNCGGLLTRPICGPPKR